MSSTLVSDNWERGSPYEQYVGRWSRRIAPRFLDWLAAASGKRWLDVGCGTGALCAAIAGGMAPLSIAGVEPSSGFLEAARANLGPGVSLFLARAESLPLGAAAVDLSVSGLVLNFIADLPAALREMRRVTVPGGTVAGYVWDYADRMELIRCFWDAAVELGLAPASQHEGNRFPLCNPSVLARAFADAGLEDVATAAIDVPTPFRDFDDYWAPFLGGQGPGPAFAMSLSQEQRARLRDRLSERLPRQADGSLQLTARAWAVRATVPEEA